MDTGADHVTSSDARQGSEEQVVVANVFYGHEARARRAALPTPARSAFDAYWAESLGPSYEHLALRASIPAPINVLGYLDILWATVSGASPASGAMARAQHQLQHLAPAIETWPVLGYAGMECVAAIYDALDAIEGNPTSVPYRAFANAVSHYLMNRDHPGELLATKDVDPLGVRLDPIWDEPTTEWHAVMGLLERPSGVKAIPVGELRQRARLLGEPLANTFARLGDELAGNRGRSVVSRDISPR